MATSVSRLLCGTWGGPADLDRVDVRPTSDNGPTGPRRGGGEATAASAKRPGHGQDSTLLTEDAKLTFARWPTSRWPVRETRRYTAGAVEHGEEKLYPLYDDLSLQFRRLQKELLR